MRFSKNRECTTPGLGKSQSSSKKLEVENAWQDNADRLAKWALRNLVNRDDVVGAYLPLNRRQPGSVAITEHKPVTLDRLKHHFQTGSSDDRAGLVGLHSTSQDNKCKWLVIDIDNHEKLAELTEANKRAALELYSRLKKFGLSPLLISSGSKGGFHIWILFREATDSRKVHELANQLVWDWKKLQLKSKPETFPKQPEIKQGEYGNFVRLPGVHHTRPAYPRVFSGEKWLKGQDAVDHLIATRPGDFPAHIIAKASKSPPSFEERYKRMLATVRRHRKGANLPAEKQETLAKFLAKLPGTSPSSSGWMACCPVHPDKTPSLSIDLGESVFVVCHCFSNPNCTFEKICEAVGMETQELTALPPRGQAQSISPEKETPTLTEASHDFQRLADHFRSQLTEPALAELAEDLGVSADALRAIGVGWNPDLGSWTFPEYNGKGQICGIVNRFSNGDKRAMPNSKRALTLPNGWDQGTGVLHICEGSSDAAAMLSRGKRAIAIPSKSFKGDDLLVLLSGRTGESLAVVPDNDASDPKHETARKLAERLKKHLRCPVKLVLLPDEFKDLRQYHASNPNH